MNNTFDCDNLQRIYLKKEVCDHEHYKNITESEEIALAVSSGMSYKVGGRGLTFEQFYSLVMKSAQAYDVSNNNRASSKPKRTVFNTIVEDEDEDDYKNGQFNTYRTQLERRKRQNGGGFRLSLIHI